jgi:hypothetical protein
LSDYKSGAGNNKLLQVSLKEKSHLDQEFTIIVETSQPVIQMSEICMGIYFKYSIYEKDMSYLPLIVMAEGGMNHVDG